jgi:hypothetical protein
MANLNLVLSANAYNFTDKTTGENISGVKLQYIDLSAQPKSTGQYRGYDLLSVSSKKIELFSNIKNVPGIYELKYDVTSGRGGKPQLALSGIEYVSDYKIEV